MKFEWRTVTLSGTRPPMMPQLSESELEEALDRYAPKVWANFDAFSLEPLPSAQRIAMPWDFG